MLQHGVDFHFIDDDNLLDATFEFENGEVSIRRNCYEVLILPPARVVSAKTMEEVKDFLQQGGKVIGLDMVPTGSMEKGDPDPAIQTMMNRLFAGTSQDRSDARMVILDESAETLTETLNHLISRPMTLKGRPNDVSSLHREVNSSEEPRGFDAIFN